MGSVFWRSFEEEREGKPKPKRKPAGAVWFARYKRGGRWVKERVVENGAGTKELADALLAKRESETFEGVVYPDKKAAGHTFGDLEDLWLIHAAEKRSLAADKARFKAILEHFGPKTQLAAIEASDIDAFKNKLLTEPRRSRRLPGEKLTASGKRMRAKMAEEADEAEPLSAATCNRHLMLLRAALNVAARNRWQTRGLERGIKLAPERNTRERTCSPEEYERLIAGAAKLPKLQLAIVIGYHCGLRLGEICGELGLTWDRVDLKAKLLRLEASGTKSGQPREVPLSAEAFEAIKAWKQVRDAQREKEDAKAAIPIDRAARAKRDAERAKEPLIDVGPETISPQFGDLTKKLGIEGLRFHDLRATFATRLANAGVPLATAMRLTGHATVGILVKRYQRASPGDLRDAIAKMESAK